MAATLIVSVDTEEEFDWSKAGTSRQWSLRHLSGIPRFQDLCDEFGIRPTYLIDYPIATSDEALALLGEIQRRGGCEIGAHIHPWVNPPYNEELCPRNTYLCNLPLSLQAEKVAELTRAVHTAFGRVPTSFKAGRYGLDFAFASSLAQMGYTVDSSVIAFTNFAHDDGPDFGRFGPEAFWLTGSGNGDRSSGLLEIPCTVGFTRRPFEWWAGAYRYLSHKYFRHLHPIGILQRLGVVRKIVLSPELSSGQDLTSLMTVIARDPNPLLNVTLHSPSLQAGHTPFVRTTDDLERLFASLRLAFEWAIERLGAQCLTLSEYRHHFSRNCIS
jgi:hypothetical protein